MLVLGLALGRVGLAWLLWTVLLLLWRRAGAGRWVVRHRSAARMGVWVPSRVAMPRWFASRAGSLAHGRLGLRESASSALAGGCAGGEAGGTGTCAVVQAACSHRACRRAGRREREGKGRRRTTGYLGWQSDRQRDSQCCCCWLHRLCWRRYLRGVTALVRAK